MRPQNLDGKAAVFFDEIMGKAKQKIEETIYCHWNCRSNVIKKEWKTFLNFLVLQTAHTPTVCILYQNRHTDPIFMQARIKWILGKPQEVVLPEITQNNWF